MRRGKLTQAAHDGKMAELRGCRKQVAVADVHTAGSGELTQELDNVSEPTFDDEANGRTCARTWIHTTGRWKRAQVRDNGHVPAGGRGLDHDVAPSTWVHPVLGWQRTQELDNGQVPALGCPHQGSVQSPLRATQGTQLKPPHLTQHSRHMRGLQSSCNSGCCILAKALTPRVNRVGVHVRCGLPCARSVGLLCEDAVCLGAPTTHASQHNNYIMVLDVLVAHALACVPELASLVKRAASGEVN